MNEWKRGGGGGGRGVGVVKKKVGLEFPEISER